MKKQRFVWLQNVAAKQAGLAVALPVIAALGVAGLGGCRTPRRAVSARGDSAGATNSSVTPSTVETRRTRRGRADTQAAPGDFDYYLLNLSWSPEFCATHAGSPECGRGLGFIVHGLWPQDANGNYPENCSNAPGPLNPQAYTDLIPTAGLVEHEWQSHGTCSGLAADAYFSAIRKAFTAVKVPADIGTGSDAAGVAPDQLLARFAQANASYPQDSFALSCGNNRLTAIEICLTKDLQPESCQGVRSCRASVVQVTSR